MTKEELIKEMEENWQRHKKSNMKTEALCLFGEAQVAKETYLTAEKKFRDFVDKNHMNMKGAKEE